MTEHPVLTAMDIQLLRLLAQGKGTGQIAQHEHQSVETIERALGQLYARLDVGNPAEAVTAGLRLGAIYPCECVTDPTAELTPQHCLNCTRETCLEDERRESTVALRRQVREARVRELQAEGCSIAEIAAQLELTERSVQRLLTGKGKYKGMIYVEQSRT